MPLTRLSLPESGGPKRARSIGALGPPINPGPRAPACKLSLGRQVKARGDGSGDCVVPPRVMCLLVGVLGALDPGAAARADFPAAMKDFNQGHYEAAHEQFLALAELGDGASQFNLGAMALQGQGGPKDPGTAVGWLMAASDNGYHGLARDKLDDMKLKLTDEQRKSADEIFQHYGHAALEQTVLPV